MTTTRLPAGPLLSPSFTTSMVMRFPAVRPGIGSVEKIFNGRRAGGAVTYSDWVRFTEAPRRKGCQRLYRITGMRRNCFVYYLRPYTAAITVECLALALDNTITTP